MNVSNVKKKRWFTSRWARGKARLAYAEAYKFGKNAAQFCSDQCPLASWPVCEINFFPSMCYLSCVVSGLWLVALALPPDCARLSGASRPSHQSLGCENTCPLFAPGSLPVWLFLVLRLVFGIVVVFVIKMINKQNKNNYGFLYLSVTLLACGKNYSHKSRVVCMWCTLEFCN